MSAQKLYLNVDIKEKDAAKMLGARWDSKVKLWYAPNERILTACARWNTLPEGPTVQPGDRKPVSYDNEHVTHTKTNGSTRMTITASDTKSRGHHGNGGGGGGGGSCLGRGSQRRYLVVQKSERFKVKRLGAKWDPEAKIWYAENEVIADACAEWSPDIQYEKRKSEAHEAKRASDEAYNISPFAWSFRGIPKVPYVLPNETTRIELATHDHPVPFSWMFAQTCIASFLALSELCRKSVV